MKGNFLGTPNPFLLGQFVVQGIDLFVLFRAPFVPEDWPRQDGNPKAIQSLSLEEKCLSQKDQSLGSMMFHDGPCKISQVGSEWSVWTFRSSGHGTTCWFCVCGSLPAEDQVFGATGPQVRFSQTEGYGSSKNIGSKLHNPTSIHILDIGMVNPRINVIITYNQCVCGIVWNDGLQNDAVGL